MNTTLASPSKTNIPHRSVLLTALVATVINTALYLIAKAAGASMGVAGAVPTVSIGAAIFSSLMSLILGGYILNFLLIKRPSLGASLSLVAVIFAALSAVSPFLAAADLPTAFGLALMHLVAAASLYRITRK